VTKKYAHIFLIFVFGQLIFAGCTTDATIRRHEYAPLLAGVPLEKNILEKIKTSSPKDAVFADLLQAFALMRTAQLQKPTVQKEISELLANAAGTFDDLRDPVNFSKAFSIDEDKDFRGRPHERVFTVTMLAVFLMAQGNYDLAISYLRNAEFLDARFQKLPFGTDSPYVYALMYWCLHQRKGSDPQEIERAADGVKKSVRFLTLQEPLVKALIKIAEVDLRPMAISNRLAYMIFEISIYHSLISAPNQADITSLIDDAVKNAEIFTSALDSNFEDEYKERLAPVIKELAHVYGLNNKEGVKHLAELAFNKVAHDVQNIGAHIKQLLIHDHSLNREIQAAVKSSESLSAKILASARLDKLILNFTGMGPTLERKGSYDEIAVIKPSKTANLHAAIRQKVIPTNIACGFHRTQQGGFSAVLCGPHALKSAQHVEALPSAELLALSNKARKALGRRFDEVLKGRAQFRAATENLSTVGAWSAFFLFQIGANIINDCNRRGEGEACYAPAFAIWAVAGVTVVFTGTIWLIGRASNPAADSRFIHLMYESAWMAI
jgi:hypothetical protein